MQCHVKEEKTNMHLICLCIRHSKVVKIVQKQLELANFVAKNVSFQI